MLLPFGTNARIRFFPFAALAIILLNFYVSAQMILGADSAAVSLSYEVIKPSQWVTSSFVHINISHLLGNLVFLWIFALIVEGMLGMLKFLMLYLGIGIFQGSIEQLLFYGSEGTSCGSTAISFALIGISMVWAPKSKIEIMPMFGFQPWTISIPTKAVAIASFLLYGFWLSYGYSGGLEIPISLALHPLGLGVGLVIGVLMLKKKLVDCQGSDCFSIRKGEPLPK